MYNKIVDVVAVASDTNPLKGGKCERWWRENSEGRHGLDKKQMNRNVSGRKDPGEMEPSVEETLRTFQFKGFEFGNWLSQSERYDVFRAFQFCLADMYAWIGSYNLGVKNSIGVAFGARGSRGALAHFESKNNMINMSKMKGAGSLLHEYAHAIDYTVGIHLDQCAKYAYLSGGRTLVQTDANVGGQFRAMLNKILIYARDTESYKKMSKAVNKIEYWGNSTEMFARLTEAYYAYYYNSKKNYYLANPVSYYEEVNKLYGIYLSKAEMDVIKPELDKFWKEIGLLLNDKTKVKATPFPVVKVKTKKEEKKDKPKVMEAPDKFVVGRTYIPHNGKVSDTKWRIKVTGRNGDSISYKFRGITYERKIKTYAGGSEYIEDGAYQNSIRWDASGELEYQKWWESITKGKKDKKKESKVGKPKSEKLYDVVMDKYTDSTYTKIKSHGYGAVSKSFFRTLDSILKNFERIEGKRIGLKSLKFISRTKYSIRFKNHKGEYCESYIVDEEGKRLKESKTPKGKGMVQKPIQF